MGNFVRSSSFIWPTSCFGPTQCRRLIDCILEKRELLCHHRSTLSPQIFCRSSVANHQLFTLARPSVTQLIDGVRVGKWCTRILSHRNTFYRRSRGCWVDECDKVQVDKWLTFNWRMCSMWTNDGGYLKSKLIFYGLAIFLPVHTFSCQCPHFFHSYAILIQISYVTIPHKRQGQ